MSMNDAPLQNVIAHCLKCNVMNDDSMELGTQRFICAHCRQLDNGIYKYDAIKTAIELHNELEIKRNKGKKTTCIKRYGKSVAKLLQEGKSIAEISRTLCISRNTIYKIKKEMNL